MWSSWTFFFFWLVIGIREYGMRVSNPGWEGSMRLSLGWEWGFIIVKVLWRISFKYYYCKSYCETFTVRKCIRVTIELCLWEFVWGILWQHFYETLSQVKTLRDFYNTLRALRDVEGCKRAARVSIGKPHKGTRVFSGLSVRVPLS